MSIDVYGSRFVPFLPLFFGISLILLLLPSLQIGLSRDIVFIFVLFIKAELLESALSLS